MLTTLLALRASWKLLWGNVTTDARTGCDLVITGFSQCGAIAATAATGLAEYNPKLITFAQHPTVWFRCDMLDTMETYLRFTGTCQSEFGEPAYDSIAYYGNPFVTRRSGTMILFGPGCAVTVAYNTGKTFLPLNMVCHDMDSPYGSGLDLIEPGPIDGYQDGSMCTTDVECESRQCLDRRCAAA